MPELPSGRRVGVSADNLLAAAREADFSLRQEVLKPEDLAPLIAVIEFIPDPEGKAPKPGRPRATGLMVADVGTNKSDWAEKDQTAFLEWLCGTTSATWSAAH